MLTNYLPDSQHTGIDNCRCCSWLWFLASRIQEGRLGLDLDFDLVLSSNLAIVLGLGSFLAVYVLKTLIAFVELYMSLSLALSVRRLNQTRRMTYKFVLEQDSTGIITLRTVGVARLLLLLYTADVGHPRSTSDKSAALNTRRARSAVSQTSRSRGRLVATDIGRTSCCFNLRRTACLCATRRAFAGDLDGVIEDCVFSRAIVNAAPISGPSPTERNKMERYKRCLSAAAAAVVDPTTVCLGSAGRTSRARRPSGVAQLTSAGVDSSTGREVSASAELIPRLYRTYGYQFTTSFRHPAALPPPGASRLVGTEVSDDDAATTVVSAIPARSRSSVSSRRGDRRRSIRHTTSSSSHSRHH